MRKKNVKVELCGCPEEERLSPSYTDLVSRAFGVVALAGCVVMAIYRRNGMGVFCGVLFGLAMLTVYTLPKVESAASDEEQNILRTVHRSVPLILISGTFLPVALCAVRGIDTLLGDVVFFVISIAAAVGIAINATDFKFRRLVLFFCYTAAIWAVMVSVAPMMYAIRLSAWCYLISGEVAYAVSAVLYFIGKRARYMLANVYVFMLAGSILHFIFMLYLF